MNRLVCVSKKMLLVGILLITFIGLIILSSSLLLNTKTQYKSRASTQTFIPKAIKNSPIFNAINAEPGRWPFMVKILITVKNNKQYICSGSLIAPGWVLTAGHCISPEWESTGIDETKSIIVYAGDSITSKSKKYFTATSYNVFRHPRFMRDAMLIHNNSIRGLFYRYDIALIKLGKIPVDQEGSPLLTISLNLDKHKYLQKDGQMSLILGWGMEDAVDMIFNELKQAVIPIISTLRKSELGDQHLGSEFIAGYPNGETIMCNGDSGGSLLVWDPKQNRWIIQGVYAYRGSACGIWGSYSVFGRIAYKDSIPAYSYTTWIIDTINKYGFPESDKLEKYFGNNYKYEGLGTFIGAVLRKDETVDYYKRICDKAEWMNKLPEICPVTAPSN